MSRVSTLPAASKPSAPTCSTATGTAARATPSSYEIRRNSELNRRGHEICEAAEHLLRLIDELDDSNAEGSLYLELSEVLGVREIPDCGTLEEISVETAGMRWVVETFLGCLRTKLLRLPVPPSPVRQRRIPR